MASKRFVYRLEQVLEMKLKKEQEEKDKLAQIFREQAHERQVKAQLEHQLETVHEELKTKRLSGVLNIAELRWFPQHIKNLENKIRYQELRLQELAIKEIEQRAALTKAAMERQTYEKHKEKAKEEWTAEIEYEEALMLDELATIKFSREARLRLEEEEKSQY